MKKIKLGRKEFTLSVFTSDVLGMLRENADKLKVENVDNSNEVEVGYLLYFILLCITGNKEQALALGQKLKASESESITMEQIIDAIGVIKEEFDETDKNRKL